MAGCVELVSQQRVKGWAPHDPARNGPALVRVSLGDTVVAEGIETAEQFDFLKHRGCDLFQGYYFARPMKLAELQAYLTSLEPAGGG